MSRSDERSPLTFAWLEASIAHLRRVFITSGYRGDWHVGPCQPGGLLLGFTNIEGQEAGITLAQKLWDALEDVQRKSHSFHFFNTPIY
ncbi:hypothetical protein [Pectobacterium polaris]|uniref:hypothetical protein n=1 Tax=Pectobacterium polaris TaxID=2042057 RepID=UPI001F40526E|nr:hypothetical protein [Pectobacterium polaris]